MRDRCTAGLSWRAGLAPNPVHEPRRSPDRRDGALAVAQAETADRPAGTIPEGLLEASPFGHHSALSLYTK